MLAALIPSVRAAVNALHYRREEPIARRRRIQPHEQLERRGIFFILLGSMAAPAAGSSDLPEASATIAVSIDFPVVNMSAYHTVSGPLRNSGEYAGMYEINIPQFYPIDDQLLGNEGLSHNRFFTFEITGDFIYEEAADYKILFMTDDDGWIFVDDKLVADLGGINGTVEQWVDMNRLEDLVELVEGETYRVRIFMADRSGASTRFHLVTNIPLECSTSKTVSAIFD